MNINQHAIGVSIYRLGYLRASKNSLRSQHTNLKNTAVTTLLDDTFFFFFFFSISISIEKQKKKKKIPIQPSNASASKSPSLILYVCCTSSSLDCSINWDCTVWRNYSILGNSNLLLFIVFCLSHSHPSPTEKIQQSGRTTLVFFYSIVNNDDDSIYTWAIFSSLQMNASIKPNRNKLTFIYFIPPSFLCCCNSFFKKKKKKNKLYPYFFFVSPLFFSTLL